MRPLLTLTIILTLAARGICQFQTWNNIYDEVDIDHFALHTDLFVIDSTFLSMGIWGSWTEFAVAKRTVDDSGFELDNATANLPYNCMGSPGNNMITRAENVDWLVNLTLTNQYDN
jgi:hypothetical protein